MLVARRKKNFCSGKLGAAAQAFDTGIDETCQSQRRPRFTVLASAASKEQS
jgi:hypothetical protein